MNIKQRHLEAIESTIDVLDVDGQVDKDIAAEKSEEITEDVAIRFAEWIIANDYNINHNKQSKNVKRWYIRGDEPFLTAIADDALFLLFKKESEL